MLGLIDKEIIWTKSHHAYSRLELQEATFSHLNALIFDQNCVA